VTSLLLYWFTSCIRPLHRETDLFTTQAVSLLSERILLPLTKRHVHSSHENDRVDRAFPQYCVAYVEIVRLKSPSVSWLNWPSLWPSGQSSWLQIQRSGFDSRHYQIFWEVMGLEQGSLSLVSTIEELLENKSTCPGLENREYGRNDPPRWPRDTLYPQKLALSSLTNGGLSVGIVRSRTQTTKLVF
jgi:hypothetical protein